VEARTANSINQNADVPGIPSICNSVKVTSEGNTLSHSRLPVYLSYPIFLSSVFVCRRKIVWHI